MFLIFHDQQCTTLNAIWMYDNIKSMLYDTFHVLKYSDINKKKKTRIYKTAKSFFRILKINTKSKTNGNGISRIVCNSAPITAVITNE